MKINRPHTLGALLLVLVVKGSPAATEEQPLVLYTDVAGSPTRGGENNSGGYLSIFGRHFGSDIAAVKVTINNVEVAAYKYLGPSLGRPDIQQLSVQVGHVSSGRIQLSVGERSSKVDLPFIATSGDIYYVSANGNDATCEANNIARPCRTAQGTYNKDGFGAGDQMVLRGGTYSDRGDGNNWLLLRTASKGGTNSQPVSIIGYPGERVVVKCGSDNGGASNGCLNHDASDGAVKYWAIADLSVHSGKAPNGPIALQFGADGARVVNIEAAHSNDSSVGAGGIVGGAHDVKLLGNHIFDINGTNTDKRDHGIYFANDGEVTPEYFAEIAYNHIHNINLGNCIQIYYGPAGANIHDNLIHDCEYSGLNLSEGSTNVSAWNNVIFNTKQSGIRLNALNPQMVIANNTLYNTSTRRGAGIDNDWNITTGRLLVQNNILYVAAKADGYLGGTVGFDERGVTVSNNLYFGIAAARGPAEDHKGIHADPKFVDVTEADFRLQPQSPAVDSGLDLRSLVPRDFDGVARPAGTNRNSQGAFDIGAFELHP